MELMTSVPVRTAEELDAELRSAANPSSDDVTILWDGRRIESRENALAWLAEVAAAREAAALGSGA
jgi:hypothetical protein